MTDIDSRCVDEQVVLLDETGHAIGTQDKPSVHHAETPLHLAFSCYVFNAAGQLLVTRRALDKATFPGVWTNTVCGHPAPGEDFVAAVRRRTRQELGISLRDLRLVLPLFRYRAVMPNGVVENEICPVMAAITDDLFDSDPAEVADTAWVGWGEFAAAVSSGHRQVSVWCKEQLDQLVPLGDNPAAWPTAPLSALPPAARPQPA